MGERQARVGEAAPPVRTFMESWIKQTNMDFARLLVQAEDVEASSPSTTEWLRFLRIVILLF
jgi:hypothetical protein